MERPLIEGCAQLLLWGQHANGGLRSLLGVRYELSAAARTFKAQALRSIRLVAPVDSCEQFWASHILDANRFGRLLPDQHWAHTARMHFDVNAGRAPARPPSLVGGCPHG